MPIAIAYSSYPEIRLLKATAPLTLADFELTQALELDKKLLYLLLDATGVRQLSPTKKLPINPALKSAYIIIWKSRSNIWQTCARRIIPPRFSRPRV